MPRNFSVSGLVRLARLAALAMLAACGQDVGVSGPGEPFRFGSPGAAVNVAVVGTWSRTVTSVDETTGAPRSTETTWAFNADGTAARSIIIRDLSLGTAERQDAFATWQIVGTEVVVNFVAPFISQVRLAFTRDGDQLILGGQTFFRTV